MKQISNLGKIKGIKLNEWFIPDMLKSIELDNSFVLWTTTDSEYFIDTTNNLLKIKYFDRTRMSFPLNIEIKNNKIILKRSIRGFYNDEESKSFKIPSIDDLLVVNNNTYAITSIKYDQGDYIIEVADEDDFTYDFKEDNKVHYIRNTELQLFLMGEDQYVKKYRSNNKIDVYINGTDIHSVAGIYY